MKKYLNYAVPLLLLVTMVSNASDNVKAEIANKKAISIKSCGEDITFNTPPEKIIMFTETNGSILSKLGVLDKVIFRSGAIGSDDVFTADLKKAVSAIPELKGKTNATGGVVLSTEAIVATGADLVLGYESTVDKKALKKAGVQLYTPDAFCSQYDVKKASWELVNTEIDKMSALFNVSEKGEQLKAELIEERSKVSSSYKSHDKTAAALYIGGEGEAVYAYGAPSMVQPIFEANNLKNIYSTSEERVFSVTAEDLLDKNPDWVVILVSDYAGSLKKGAIKRLLQINGTSGMKAVEKGQVLFLPFNLVDPPNNLSVKGATALKELMNK